MIVNVVECGHQLSWEWTEDKNKSVWDIAIWQVRWDISCLGEKWSSNIWPIFWRTLYSFPKCCVSQVPFLYLYIIILIIVTGACWFIHSKNQTVCMLGIYRKENRFGIIGLNKDFVSIETMIKHYTEEGIPVSEGIAQLTNQLFPDK